MFIKIFSFDQPWIQTIFCLLGALYWVILMADLLFLALNFNLKMMTMKTLIQSFYWKTYQSETSVSQCVTHVGPGCGFGGGQQEVLATGVNAEKKTPLQQGSTDQNVFHLIMVACWYAMASPSGTAAHSDPLRLCLHFSQTDYIRRNQNIRQKKTDGDGGCLENKEQPPLHLHPSLHLFILTPPCLPLPAFHDFFHPKKHLTIPPPSSAVSVSLPVPGTRSEPCRPFINLSPVCLQTPV